VAARLGERRAQLFELADSVGVGLAATGTHPGALAGAAHHRHAALPPQRRDPPLRRLAQQHVRLHVHVAINGPDRAIAVCNALRNFLPELLALSASSPFVEA
jgi:carboxylate-amine ligase